ncbi:hypothetical protein HYW99_01765 [Candidatus Woesearchaeota archaeon]|nr:hypothetical protein [Candidatus Woesearchaeota archaeon]
MVAQNLQLEGFMRTLEMWGIRDVMLPFLLIFVILYAILQKTKILGEGKKNLSAAVAIIIGLLVVIPHVTQSFPPNADPVEIMNAALPQVSIVIVAIIFLLILLGVFGQDYVMLGVTAPGWVMLFSLAVIIIIFGGAAGWWTDSLGTQMENVFGTEAIAIFVMILVFGIIIAWVTHEPKEEGKSLLNRLGVDLNKLFKK